MSLKAMAPAEKYLQTTPGFDIDVFNQLQMDTSSEVAVKILARFLVTLSESVTEIRAALLADNADSVWRACHKVTGTAELLGFVDLGKQSRELNKNLQATLDLASYEEELELFLIYSDHIRHVLKNYFSTIIL